MRVRDAVPAAATRRWLPSLLLWLALIPMPAEARVTLIGVDGASWNLIDPMLAAGELPHLAALMARGVHAELETVEPVNSPVVWTSIATGRSPDAHDITDFFATRLRIRTPTSFERLSHAGLRVGLYDYLVTWPPAAFDNGFVIPGWLRRDASVTPPDVWDRVPSEPFVNSFDRALTNLDYLARAERDVTEKASRWLQLADAFDLEVGAVTFYAVDMTSHRFWEAGFPSDFDQPSGGYDDRERNAIANALRGVDRSIGQITAAGSEDDLVLVASDHGFHADPEGSRDVWVTDLDATLARADLDPERDGFSLVGTFGAVTIRVQPGPVAARDAVIERLLATLRSFVDPQGEPLYAAVEAIDVAPRPPGAERAWSTRLRQWIVRKGAEWIFGVQLDSTAQAVVFALPDRDLLGPMWPDGKIEVLGETAPIQSALHRQRFTGVHDPIGVFVAAGGPIAVRESRGRLSVLDISPLLFYATGQPLPDDLEGQLPETWIRPDYLSAHPPTSQPASALPQPTPTRDTGGQDPALVNKLRALGYIE